ncbi:MAG: BamA/TamA family outer membrane protein [Bacteroidetes Order II. Incertae sedis bacterium]|nr:BamA/TamA family outer membrane protein [Bacteroidetes Order II. bacterium]
MVIKSVKFLGLTDIEERFIREQMAVRALQKITYKALQEDLERILNQFIGQGFLLTRVYIEDALVDSQEQAGWHLVIRVEKGPPVKFSGLVLTNPTRIKSEYIRAVLGLKSTQWMTQFDPETARTRLQEMGVFEQVASVEVKIDPNLDAQVVVKAQDRPPGSFDLALGYLPKSQAQKAGVVGNGTLLLRSVMGRGEELQAQINRMPGQSNQAEIAARWPFVMGLPIRFRGKWTGQQRDSTFNQSGFELETGYVQANRLEFFASVDRRSIRPGVKGNKDGLARSDAWFVGIGVGYEMADSRVNPRKGAQVVSVLQQGKKDVQRLDGARESVNQQRLSVVLRIFVPTFRRQVWVLGGDFRALFSPFWDDADLFRFGGATSLRGYNEEQFKGNAGGRCFTEYRYQLDAASYAFVFFDGGMLQTPKSVGNTANRLVRMGYGVGLQYSTPLGLMQVSYAANPEEGPANGRLHIGLKLGL